MWAMLCASITGDLKAVRSLVAHDPKLIECEYEYFKPLRFAIRENQRAVVDFLLENGANPGYETGNEFVTIGRERGFEDLVLLLEAKRKEQYHVVPEADAVVAAIKGRDVGQVRTLLEKQPDLLHAADEFGSQPLHWAVMTRQLELIDYLLERGADINAARPNGTRPIHLTNGDYNYRGWRDLPSTAIQQHEILIGYLLARGAHYDIATATKLGDLDRVRELLDEDPALDVAERLGDLQIMELILRHQPDFLKRTPDPTPWWSLATPKTPDFAHWLIERGLDPNRPNWLGITMLHRCAAKGDIAMAEVFLNAGADIDAVETDSCCTPLAAAARTGKREMVDWLLAKGANRNIPEDEPWAQPLEWAKRKMHDAIAMLLSH